MKIQGMLQQQVAASLLAGRDPQQLAAALGGDPMVGHGGTSQPPCYVSCGALEVWD